MNPQQKIIATICRETADTLLQMAKSGDTSVNRLWHIENIEVVGPYLFRVTTWYEESEEPRETRDMNYSELAVLIMRMATFEDHTTERIMRSLQYNNITHDIYS